MSGTFRARFVISSFSGNAFTPIGGGIDIAYGYPINSTKSGAINFDLEGNCFFLDGSVVGIPFAALPAGFTLTGNQTLSTPGAGESIPGAVGDVQAVAPSSSTALVSYGPYSKSFVPPSDLVGIGIIVTDIAFVTPLSLLSFLTISITMVHNVGTNTCNIVGVIDITGTYTIQQSQFTLDTTSPINVGDKVKISDANGKLKGIDHVKLDYTDPIKGPQTIIIPTDSYLIILWDSFQFWFYLPSLGGFQGSLNITLVGNGIQFSGSVLVGTLNVLSPDISGIYTLIDSQTDDIVYFRNGYITIPHLLFLQFLTEEEIYDEGFYDLLSYPTRILNLTDELDDDFEQFSPFGTLQISYIPTDVEIPSPFANTAFLP